MMSIDKLAEAYGSRQKLWLHLFTYSDGILLWLNPRAPKLKTGDIAGSMNTRYWSVNVAGKTIYAHRIIWEMHNGDIEEGFEIDHIDRDAINNTIENLRLADRTLNTRNIGLRRDNSSSIIGVFKRGDKWRAQICIKGKQKTLGDFNNKDDAVSARKVAETLYHGGVRT